MHTQPQYARMQCFECSQSVLQSSHILRSIRSFIHAFDTGLLWFLHCKRVLPVAIDFCLIVYLSPSDHNSLVYLGIKWLTIQRNRQLRFHCTLSTVHFFFFFAIQADNSLFHCMCIRAIIVFVVFYFNGFVFNVFCSLNWLAATAVGAYEPMCLCECAVTSFISSVLCLSTQQLPSSNFFLHLLSLLDDTSMHAYIPSFSVITVHLIYILNRFKQVLYTAKPSHAHIHCSPIKACAAEAVRVCACALCNSYK